MWLGTLPFVCFPRNIYTTKSSARRVHCDHNYCWSQCHLDSHYRVGINTQMEQQTWRGKLAISSHTTSIHFADDISPLCNFAEQVIFHKVIKMHIYSPKFSWVQWTKQFTHRIAILFWTIPSPQEKRKSFDVTCVVHKLATRLQHGCIKAQDSPVCLRHWPKEIAF